LDLDKVPCREDGMTPYEMMLSESQERMLMVLKPGREGLAQRMFEKWDLDFAIVGRLTESGRMVLKMHGETVGDLPIDPLAQAAPEYRRPTEETPPAPVVAAAEVPAPADSGEALLSLLACPDLCSRAWVWEQYDHMVMADTAGRPGGDAAVVRIHGSQRALAITTDCTPRYCQAAPRTGGAQAVAEAWRNLTAVGARPLAVTDNLNFGNPERPRVMGQFADCVLGIGEACRALDFPVVSGNVSLYNETNGKAIPPTPAIGGLGLIDDLARSATLALKAAGEDIVLIGATQGHLGASLYLRELAGGRDGAPPPVDLAAERRNGDFVRGLIAAGQVSACHDLSDGGLAVALAEMALAGNLGAEVALPAGLGLPPLHAWLFGEDQARYLVTTPGAGAILEAARRAGVPAARIGASGGDTLKLPGSAPISLTRLRAAHEAWLPAYMGDGEGG
jgi:phosphoribosylformylglycinamidine synthase